MIPDGEVAYCCPSEIVSQIGVTRIETNLTDEPWKTLVAQWPQFFGSKSSRRKISQLEIYGIQCDEGWYDLLSRLLVDFNAIARRSKIPYPRIRQIKEKFGCLRVHLSAPREGTIDPELLAVIEQYSRESETICETCGAIGRLFKGQYWTTRCDEHRPNIN